MYKKYCFVYISTNKRHTVLYVGVTNNIFNRNNQHKIKLNKNSFTARYNVNKIVYYETYTNINRAIEREKQIKRWRREKKIMLINTINSDWDDLIELSLQ